MKQFTNGPIPKTGGITSWVIEPTTKIGRSYIGSGNGFLVGGTNGRITYSTY